MSEPQLTDGIGKLARWAFAITASVLFVMYFLTLAPDITWANNSADSGDLITAAFTDGVAHPSGYPTYLLVAKLFQSVPFGSLAWRTNLLSAMSMALASGLLALSVFKWLSSQGKANLPSFLGAVAAGVGFGTAGLTWGQAVVTEVHALQMLFLTILVYSLTTPRRWYLDLIFGTLAGLSLGNHLTIILFLPVWLILFTLKCGNPYRPALPITKVALFLGLALGISIYLLIPIWANGNSPVVWGQPTNLAGLWWLVSGDFYQINFNSDLQVAFARLLEGLNYIFGNTALMLVPAVLGFGLKNEKQVPLPLYIVAGALIFTSLAFFIVYAVSDANLYLLPAILAGWLLGGYGIAALLEFVLNKDTTWGSSVIALFVLLLGFQIFVSFEANNLSGDNEAVLFGQGVLASAPPSAVLIADNDQEVLTLWYYHFARGMRPDVAIIALGLMDQQWYRELLANTYDGLNVPVKFSTNDWPIVLKELNTERLTCSIEEKYFLSLECQ